MKKYRLARRFEAGPETGRRKAISSGEPKAC
jgi:hypothetical protein